MKRYRKLIMALLPPVALMIATVIDVEVSAVEAVIGGILGAIGVYLVPNELMPEE